MSTPVDTDLILVERSGTLYKETKENWDDATAGDGGGGGGGGGVTATNGIVFQWAWGMNTTGWNGSGRHRYGPGGTMYYVQSDSAGTYTLSSATGSSYASHRPRTGIKVGGTWYELGSDNISTSTTGNAGPFNVYYKRRAVSWCYTPAEIVSALGGSTNTATITAMRCYMNNAINSSYNSFPNWTAGVKLINGLTNTATNYGGTNGGSFTQIASVNPQTWNNSNSSWEKEITFSSSLSWS